MLAMRRISSVSIQKIDVNEIYNVKNLFFFTSWWQRRRKGRNCF
jgi:hypothetical protein